MKILVISAAGIGDTLIATPFLHEMRANFPNAELDVFVVWKGSRDLLEGNPHLNQIWQKNLLQASIFESTPFLLKLRRRRYDVSVNVHTLGRIHYRAVARWIGARQRLSHEYEGHNWIDRCLVNRTTPQDYSVHSVVNNNRLLPLLGKQPILPSHDFELFLTSAEVTWAQQFAMENHLAGQPCLGMHVGSGGTKNLALKRWPFAHWIELLRRITTAFPKAKLMLFGGPEETEAHGKILQLKMGTQLLLPQTKNLRQAAALMKHLDGFLSVDTALMHLAAAMKVPNQMVIEAPTLNPTNLPWNNPCQVIRNPIVAGRNLEYYRYDGRPIRGTAEELVACMSSITVEAVFSAVKSTLDSILDGGGRRA